MRTAWELRYEGYEPKKERLREALTTVGNGYLATRGAAPESRADDHHYPGTYLAGVFNRRATEIDGHVIENEDLVNQPNWLVLDFAVAGGAWFSLDDSELLEHWQSLDLRHGVLIRHLRFRDPHRRVTRVTQRRLVSMAHPHLAALETTFAAENWSGGLLVRSGVDAGVENTLVERYRDLPSDHLEIEQTGEPHPDSVLAVVATNQSRVRVAVCAHTRVYDDGASVEPPRRLHDEDGLVAHELSLELEQDQPVTVDKVVAVHTSRDAAISEPAVAATEAVTTPGRFDDLYTPHLIEWERLWRRFDIEVDADERTQLIVRLHLFHLLVTASPNSLDLDVGVPARGLHGEAYRGHIFWDELFILPLVTFRLPELTRNLLLYRYRRLERARRQAREVGHDGALLPWQSGSDGREESQRIHLNPRSGRWVPDNSHLQRHIAVAVAFNVWHYIEVTGDEAFLRYYGAELLVEISRFLVSLTTYDRSRDRYEIRGVMGPDEYHDAYPDSDSPGLDNNAYTNAMTAWTLHRTLELLERLSDYHRVEVVELLGLTRSELERWDEIGRKMLVPFLDNQVISQFEGYEDLEEFDWEGYEARYGDIHRLDRILEAEGDTPNRYRLSKQADVLMLFYLLSADELRDLFAQLGYDLPPEAVRRNVDFYLSRTSHGSTLSRVVHAWVLARSDRAQSWHFLHEALESDVSDVQGGTTEEGIHLGAMAGTVDLVQRCYTGLDARKGVLHFDPALPEQLEGLRFSLHYRGHRLDVEFTPDVVRVNSTTARAAPVRLAVGDEEVELAPDGRHEFDLSSRSAG